MAFHHSQTQTTLSGPRVLCVKNIKVQTILPALYLDQFVINIPKEEGEYFLQFIFLPRNMEKAAGSLVHIQGMPCILSHYSL